MAASPDRDRLSFLAVLLRDRNAIDAKIASLIGRPVFAGHIGEFIAARVFDIEMNTSATAKGHDGVFRSGPHTGKTVNVKMHAAHSGLLDMSVADPPDLYLVVAGPSVPAATSRGTHRPLVIESVFLLSHEELLASGVKPGIAASVRKAIWTKGCVFPSASEEFPIAEEQKEILRLFGPIEG